MSDRSNVSNKSNVGDDSDKSDNRSGSVSAIWLTPTGGGSPAPVDVAKAGAGAGLEGDRYSAGDGTFSKTARDPGQEITLIESEAVRRVIDAGVDISGGLHRRNVETEGVRLNALVEKTFQVGGATLRGIRLCHPCNYLNRKTGHDLTNLLENAGGLRCQVVEGGVIRVGDAIRV